DANARMKPSANVFAGGGPVVVFTRSEASPGIAALRMRGAKLETVNVVGSAGSRDPDGGVQSAAAAATSLDLAAVLARLAELDVNELRVEAGPTLTGAFVREGLVDELLLYVAPKLLGPQSRPLFDLPLLESLQQAMSFSIVESKQTGPDLRLRLRPV